MSEGLFDVPQHCTDCGRELVSGLCAWCSSKARHPMEWLAPVKDLEWTHRADQWLTATQPGDVITADDLIDAIGLPMGSENQIGARFQSWRKAGYIRQAGYTTSTRASNHGRVLRQWEVQQ